MGFGLCGVDTLSCCVEKEIPKARKNMNTVVYLDIFNFCGLSGMCCGPQLAKQHPNVFNDTFV